MVGGCPFPHTTHHPPRAHIHISIPFPRNHFYRSVIFYTTCYRSFVTHLPSTTRPSTPTGSRLRRKIPRSWSWFGYSICVALLCTGFVFQGRLDDKDYYSFIHWHLPRQTVTTTGGWGFIFCTHGLVRWQWDAWQRANNMSGTLFNVGMSGWSNYQRS